MLHKLNFINLLQYLKCLIRSCSETKTKYIPLFLYKLETVEETIFNVIHDSLVINTLQKGLQFIIL